MEYHFSGKIWLYSGQGAWHFVTLPKNIAAEIKEIFGQKRPGWGSVRVMARVGQSNWQTSIFPDKKSGSYLLPIKADVRKANHLSNGDTAKVKLQISLEA